MSKSGKSWLVRIAKPLYEKIENFVEEVSTKLTLSNIEPPRYGRSISWDEKTVNWIADHGQIDVRVTRINRTLCMGRSEPESWEVYGLIEFPKLIAVNVAFIAEQNDKVGGFFYNIFNFDRFGTNPMDIPLLEMYFFDHDNRIKRAVYEAHRDAILSGRNYSSFRVFKKQKYGYMNEDDKLKGWSESQRYDLDSFVTWADLTHEHLPKWALPPSDSNFSLRGLEARE